MDAIIGVNEISIKFAKFNNIPLIIGPYEKQLEDVKHINESINFPSIESILNGIDRVYNFTFNFLTSFVIEEICLEKSINLVSILPFGEGIIVKFSKPRSCIRCITEERKISNYFFLQDKLSETDEDTLFKIVNISMNEKKDFFIHKGRIEETTSSCECRNERKYASYEYGEMINPDCGNGTSGVFPVDDRKLDIKKFSELFKRHNINIILEDDNYINFEAEGRKMFLFENGRLMISDLKDKIAIEYLYRKYVGN